MELTEMEKRMLYQTEGCERYAIINELSMASQYAGDPARRKAARNLMEKLRPLSDVGRRIERDANCELFFQPLSH